eukprot:TRINITY_DN30382_c0_g2_i2.p1 TRINITY_DN30382_c0_g2~~TRINITY_DN30382_c0_g2_i2.p1  ORF type:complete len:372 (-),score=52.55 TRINITY_DN30382_c0_g2_i2:532-1647(-)
MGPGTPLDAQRLLEAFLQWCERASIQSDQVVVEERLDRGRCIVAASDCQAHATLISLPPTAVIAEPTDHGKPAAPHWAWTFVQRLVDERRKGSCSEYEPYIRLLFAGDQGPDYCCWTELPGEAGVMARGRVDNRDKLLKAMRQNFPEVSDEDARHALYIASSRAILSKLGDDAVAAAAAAERVLALCPLFDFINHDVTPSARWEMASDMSLKVVACRDMRAGDEVTISYNKSPAASLLMSYGFLPDALGPHSSTVLQVKSSEIGNGHYELKILADGRIAQGDGLRSVLRAACRKKSTSAASLVSSVLLACAREEMQRWSSFAHGAGDSREDQLAIKLAQLTCRILERHMDLLRTWQEDAAGQSFMEALVQI